MNSEKIQVFDEAFCRLDIWLSRQYPEISRSLLARIIRAGKVSVNRELITKAGKKVLPGDLIQIQWPEKDLQYPPAQQIPLQIVYEDRDILVINKPAGMIVHPVSPFQRDTLVNALYGYEGTLADYGRPLRPGIVHRLDRDTSGIMVVAKTNVSYLGLIRSFKERLIEKWYLAIVEGKWGSRDIIDMPVGRNRAKPWSMQVNKRGGKEAMTMIDPVRSSADLSLLSVRPATGRTHQIRVHLAAMGHPIAGDSVYGSHISVAGLTRHALHAFILKFDHPVSGKRLTFAASPSQDIQAVIARLYSGKTFS